MFKLASKALKAGIGIVVGAGLMIGTSAAYAAGDTGTITIKWDGNPSVALSNINSDLNKKDAAPTTSCVENKCDVGVTVDDDSFGESLSGSGGQGDITLTVTNATVANTNCQYVLTFEWVKNSGLEKIVQKSKTCSSNVTGGDLSYSNKAATITIKN